MRKKGFSLLELIVVVAMIGIAVGLISTSVSVVFSSNANQCAADINSLLSKCRVGAMSRTGPVFIKLTQESDGIHAEYHDGGAVSDDVIGGKRVSLTFWVKVGSVDTEYAVTDTGALYLSFNRETGALLPMSGAYVLATGSAAAGLPESSTECCTRITATSGGQTRSVKLIPSTGSHRVES